MRQSQQCLPRFASKAIVEVFKSPKRLKKKKKKTLGSELFNSPYVKELLPPVEFKSSKKYMQTFSIFADPDPSVQLRNKLFVRSTPTEDRDFLNHVSSSPSMQTVKPLGSYPPGADKLNRDRLLTAKDTKTPMFSRKIATSPSQQQRPKKDRGKASRIRSTKEIQPSLAQLDRIGSQSSDTQNYVIREFNRRRQRPSETRVFILNSQDDHIRRALLSRGWAENSNTNSSAFSLKWTYTDSDADYKELRPGQLFNHFFNNRSLTTKSGLCKALRRVCTYGVNTDSFFPRCYDLGDLIQMEEFRQDYLKTSVFIVLKKHADLAGLDCVPIINRICLKKAIRYASKLISEIEDNCEYKVKYAFMTNKDRSSSLSHEDFEALARYSKLSFPIDEASLDKNLYSKRWEVDHAWGEADEADLERCSKLLKRLADYFPQFANDGMRNLWVIKPGQNSKGSGVTLTDSLEEVVERGLNMQSRVVQKYVERPLLLPTSKGLVKFDIRQWVLVTSFEPLKVYLFNSCYLRLCLQAFDIESPDILRHLTNFSLQKSIAKLHSDTVWSLDQFIEYLATDNSGVTWGNHILPKIVKIVQDTLTALGGSIEPRSVRAM